MFWLLSHVWRWHFLGHPSGQSVLSRDRRPLRCDDRAAYIWMFTQSLVPISKCIVGVCHQTKKKKTRGNTHKGNTLSCACVVRRLKQNGACANGWRALFWWWYYFMVREHPGQIRPFVGVVTNMHFEFCFEIPVVYHMSIVYSIYNSVLIYIIRQIWTNCIFVTMAKPKWMMFVWTTQRHICTKKRQLPSFIIIIILRGGFLHFYFFGFYKDWFRDCFRMYIVFSIGLRRGPSDVPSNWWALRRDDRALNLTVLSPSVLPICK